VEPFVHTRADGYTVRLTGPRWRMEIRTPKGKLVEAPQEWLVEHASGARTVTLRKCAEPIAFGAEIAADVMAQVTAMARLKSGEREAFELALTEGRPITLKNLLRNLDGRRSKNERGAVSMEVVSTRALCDRVKHCEQVAVAALDPALVAALDAYICAARAA
jgi:hypothetical protein